MSLDFTLPLKLGQIEMDNQEGIIFDHFAIWKRKKNRIIFLFIIYQIYVFQLLYINILTLYELLRFFAAEAVIISQLTSTC